MTKELQDLAWNCLPKEFKEEVKKLAQYYSRHVSALFGTERQRADKFYREFVSLFGKHNLTSDAEGEEMLTVSRKQVQEMYYYNEEILSQDPDHSGAILLKKKLTDLFGAKCLPDELTEDNFANKEPLHGDNLAPEPQPSNRTPSSYTQPVTDCHHTDRLRIAAMAMQGLLSNADRMNMYEDIASDPLSDNLTRIVARNALRYADALVAEAHKPTQC